MKRFLKLPNKLIVDVDNIAFVLNPELNQYVIIPKQSITPAVPKLDSYEYDALVAYLGSDLDVLVVERPVVSEKDKPLIARLDDDKKTASAANAK